MPKTNPNAQQGNTGEIIRTAAVAAGGPGGAPATLNEEARSVEVVLATETAVREYDYRYGFVDTVLLMSGATWPASGQVPALDAHSRWSVRDQIGSLRAFEVRGNELIATASFSTTAEAERAFTLVREGHLRDVSVCCRVFEHLFVEEKNTHTIGGRTFTGPIKLVTRWEVVEGSFCPIGADKNAKTRAALGTNPEDYIMPTVEENGRAEHAPAQTTPETVNRTVPGNMQGTPQGAAAPAAEQAARAENTPAAAPAASAQAESPGVNRSGEIADMFTVARAHGCEDLFEQALREDTSLTAFNTRVLAHIGQRSATNAPGFNPTMEVGRSDNEKWRAAITDGILLRSGFAFGTAALAEGAENLRGHSLMELARESLRRAGLPTGGDPMDMVGRAFTTTSDYPAALADVGRRFVRQGVEEANETFEDWTGEESVTNFRLHTGVDIGAFSTFKETGEHGEYKTGYVPETGVTYSVTTFGMLFGITRYAVINDDLNIFRKIPLRIGRAGHRTRGNTVFDLVLNKENLADGKPLFHLDRKNKASIGAAITAASFKEGIVGMAKHTDKEKNPLAINAAYLLSGITRSDEAFRVLVSGVTGTQELPGQENPWKGRLVPVADQRIDVLPGGKNPWFMLGPKGTAINRVYLNGNKNLRIEQRYGWTIDGVEMKASLDFGAYVEDPRAMWMNPGE